MPRLKPSGHWIVFNLTCTAVLLFVIGNRSPDWTDEPPFDLGLESAKWAVRFLLASLTMTPLSHYFGWRKAVRLRKSAGLWSLAFALLHVQLYISSANFTWLRLDMPGFLFLGLMGLIILIALATTSNRWAMKRLKKNWKRLHRLVYLAAIAVVYHALLATSHSKKLMVRAPEAVQEIYVYLAILTVLLLVRIPVVRHALQGQRWRRRRQVARGLHTPDLSVKERPVWRIPPVYLTPNGQAANGHAARRHSADRRLAPETEESKTETEDPVPVP